MKLYYIEGKFQLIGPGNELDVTLGKHFGYHYGSLSLFKQHLWNAQNLSSSSITDISNLDERELSNDLAQKYNVIVRKYPVKDSDSLAVKTEQSLKIAEEYRNVLKTFSYSNVNIPENAVTLYIKGDQTHAVLPKSALDNGTVAEHFVYCMVEASKKPAYILSNQQLQKNWIEREVVFKTLMATTKETAEIYHFLSTEEPLYASADEDEYTSIWDDANTISMMEFLACLYEFESLTALNQKPTFVQTLNSSIDESLTTDIPAEPAATTEIIVNPFNNGFNSIDEEMPSFVQGNSGLDHAPAPWKPAADNDVNLKIESETTLNNIQATETEPPMQQGLLFMLGEANKPLIKPQLIEGKDFTMRKVNRIKGG